MLWVPDTIFFPELVVVHPVLLERESILVCTHANVGLDSMHHEWMVHLSTIVLFVSFFTNNLSGLISPHSNDAIMLGCCWNSIQKIQPHHLCHCPVQALLQ